MAIVRIPEEGRSLKEFEAARDLLDGVGILYERWAASREVAPDAHSDEILAAYASEIERLKQEGGYVTADVIDIKPETPGLDGLLAKFSREHWHAEDEVRFIVEGRGIFHVRPRSGPVVAIEVVAGDLLRVPQGTWHWFDLCQERRIRAIRLFQDPAGWTPHYTDSGAEGRLEPVCLGPSQIPPADPVA